MTDVQVESGLTKKRGRTQKSRSNFYDAAVAEARQIIATAESGRMRLGELAAQVETNYGESSLKAFAKDIGMALCTLQRSRSIWRAWAEISATPPKLYSVAQELQAHPDRAQIITDNPNITVREARKKTQEWKEKQQQADPKIGLGRMKKLFNDLLRLASKSVRDANLTNLNKEERRNLKKAITNPKLLDEFREAARTWTGLADDLQHLVDDTVA
jgi:hypothetical protein